MSTDVPARYATAVEEERAALRRLTDRAKLLAEEDDQQALRTLATEIRQGLRNGDSATGGHIGRHVQDIITTLDDIYDATFPVGDPDDAADVLDAPWPTAWRAVLLESIIARHYGRPGDRSVLVQPAVASGDVRLLRLLVCSPVGTIQGYDVVPVLDALHNLGQLDTMIVEHAMVEDRYLGHAVRGRAASCAGVVQDVFDELLWRLTAPGEPARPLPELLVPRGLRFVRRALHWPEGHPLAERLGAATLTRKELTDLRADLRDQPFETRLRAYRLRVPAGDADALLPLLGTDETKALLALVQESESSYEAARYDRAAILAVAARAGMARTRSVLEICPSEIVSAALGWNRAAVLKRVKNNALRGIAAYGLLPLDDGETVHDRYAALREVAKRGARLGPNRKHSHAAAIEIALDHLAQVAGFPNASSLEWECEARIATGSPPEEQAGDYTIGLILEDAEPVIAVSNKAGKRLKSVPAAVRKHPSYTGLREHQERLRDQARRMRTGLIERLVATGGTLSPAEIASLRNLPCGEPLLSALAWQDRDGTIGFLDQVDVAGPLTAVHPHALYERQVLADWQAEIVHRRIRQPVKQVFRELYLLTPAEREAGDTSRRFAGHTVNGKVAAHLLSGRGWKTDGRYSDYQATKRCAPGLTAGLRCDVWGFFGMDDAVTTGEVRFLSEGRPVPLDTVPPAAFSETMRDLDLMVSVAGTEPNGYTSPAQAGSRARLLATLVAELALDRVTVEGTSATVRGSRATYRVNLTSGSIHLEPGGYLCIVPESFGGKAHQRLFLPFADEDRMTSVILSKVLLLNEDESITDRVILDQIPSRPNSPAG